MSNPAEPREPLSEQQASQVLEKAVVVLANIQPDTTNDLLGDVAMLYASYVDKLAELTTLRAAQSPRWVKVSERLPEMRDAYRQQGNNRPAEKYLSSKQVVINRTTGRLSTAQLIADYDGASRRWVSDSDGLLNMHEVAEWLEEPPAPQQVGQTGEEENG